MTFHSDQFPGFNSEEFWFSDSLIKYDDTGFLGIFVIPLNYFLISTSRHPFLMHVNRPGNHIQRMTYAFMMGLTSYFFPTVIF